MQKHVKIYMKHYGYGEQDIVLCQVCEAVAVDIHHIRYRSHGGEDEINNLIALCRNCHDKAHRKLISPEKLFEKIENSI